LREPEPLTLIQAHPILACYPLGADQANLWRGEVVGDFYPIVTTVAL
jgi:hypothetical protein